MTFGVAPLGSDGRLEPGAGPLPRFVLVLAVLAVVCCGGASALFGAKAGLGAMIAFGAMACVAVFGLVQHYPHRALGWCNIVTAIRLGIVAMMCGVLIVTAQEGAIPLGWTVFVLAATGFMLDGADGWLARREGVVSAFGARFDMEVDAVFAACLSLILLASGKAGVEILLLGFARYAFIGASLVWPVLANPLPQRLRRKVICVIQIGTLVFLLVPISPSLPLLSFGVAIVLAWSFAADIYWLVRQR